MAEVALTQTLQESAGSGSPAGPRETGKSHGQILKSTALVGGSSLVNIAIGVLRTKAMAVLLGPGGTGLIGLYGSVADLSTTIAGLGIYGSGVRQVAEAVSSGDSRRLARSVTVLRRVSFVLGVVGATLMVAFSRPISMSTFGDGRHAAAISVLSIAVLFRLIAAGQGALIQGIRRIGDLARMGVLGTAFGTLVGIPVVYLFRENGIIPSLICVAAFSVLTSWRYSRRIHVDQPTMGVSEVLQETGPLLKLGLAFMFSALMTVGSAYVVRTGVARSFGIEGAGLYQSASSLGIMYVGIVLQAMSTDFYPRLTAVANDNEACNRLVNEQAHVGLLIAGPGVIATLTFAPLVIFLFYTARFTPAIGILRWITLGTILQVISWPMGFILLAKARQNLFLLSDLAWTIVYIVLVRTCMNSFGLNGVGIAYFASYIFHTLMTYPLVHRLSGFRWSSENRNTILLYLTLIGGVFLGVRVLPLAWAMSMGMIAFLFTSAYSLRELLNLVDCDLVPRRVTRVLSRIDNLSAVVGKR